MSENQTLTKTALLEDLRGQMQEREAISITLVLSMPGGDVEVISNDNPEGKLSYLENAYDEALRHKGNPAIRIVDAALHFPREGLTFGEALEIAKAGGKIARKGWNGKGMYVFIAHDAEFRTPADIGEFMGVGVEVRQMLVMRTADGALQPGWLASQADMLAEDWVCVE